MSQKLHTKKSHAIGKIAVRNKVHKMNHYIFFETLTFWQSFSDDHPHLYHFATHHLNPDAEVPAGLEVVAVAWPGAFVVVTFVAVASAEAEVAGVVWAAAGADVAVELAVALVDAGAGEADAVGAAVVDVAEFGEVDVVAVAELAAAAVAAVALADEARTAAAMP